jgi:hypothetical protein
MARRDDKAPLDGRTRELLGAYRAELLRWNQQINLLSRRDAEGTADTLIRQCLDAFEMWWLASGAELTAGGALRLFDLGSGGGLPAFVWLAQLKARGVVTRATLVEPRAKRAWFLERLTHLPGAPAFEVVASRWGDRLAFGPFGPEAPTADAAVPPGAHLIHSQGLAAARKHRFGRAGRRRTAAAAGPGRHRRAGPLPAESWRDGRAPGPRTGHSGRRDRVQPGRDAVRGGRVPAPGAQGEGRGGGWRGGIAGVAASAGWGEASRVEQGGLFHVEQGRIPVPARPLADHMMFHVEQWLVPRAGRIQRPGLFHVEHRSSATGDWQPATDDRLPPARRRTDPLPAGLPSRHPATPQVHQRALPHQANPPPRMFHVEHHTSRQQPGNPQPARLRSRPTLTAPATPNRPRPTCSTWNTPPPHTSSPQPVTPRRQIHIPGGQPANNSRRVLTHPPARR